MQANKLFQTSSFRLTLISSAIFVIALLLLLYFIISSTVAALVKQAEMTVESEIAEIFNDASGGDLALLSTTVTRMSGESPQFFYLLQSKDGQHLAGNLPTMNAVAGVRDWSGNALSADAEFLHLHGIGVRALDDSYLFVGLRAYRAAKMYVAVTRTFIWMMVPTFAALMLGGLFMSNRMLARVEAISRTSRDIVSGDLQRRVPIQGTNDEFDRLALSLNSMLDQIQNLMSGLRQVSDGIAHDLRTPLTHLRQRLENARANANSVEELQEVLDHAITHVDAILAIFASLLRIAQVESGIRKGAFKPLDLSKILNDIVELYRPLIETRQQVLTADIATGLRIIGDRELVTQLFVNILDNATNHAGDRCKISIVARKFSDRISVELNDDGPGIPDVYKSDVFKRFFRLEQSRSLPGNGLGLSLVTAVAELHDAELNLSSNKPGLKVSLVFKPEPEEQIAPPVITPAVITTEPAAS